MGDPTIEKTGRGGKEVAYVPHLLYGCMDELYRMQMRNLVARLVG